MPKQGKKMSFPQKKKGKSMKEISRKTKLHIRFDETDRRKYLKGFHKRKEERREKAKKEMTDAIKKEKKEMKKERREALNNLIKANELQLGIKDEEEEEVEEEGSVTVTSCGNATVEISTLDLSNDKHLNIKKEIVEDEEKVVKEENEAEDEEDIDAQEKLLELGILNQKDLNRSIKKTAMRAMQRSKLLKQKQKLDARKQKMQKPNKKPMTKKSIKLLRKLKNYKTNNKTTKKTSRKPVE